MKKLILTLSIIIPALSIAFVIAFFIIDPAPSNKDQRKIICLLRAGEFTYLVRNAVKINNGPIIYRRDAKIRVIDFGTIYPWSISHDVIDSVLKTCSVLPPEPERTRYTLPDCPSNTQQDIRLLTGEKIDTIFLNPCNDSMIYIIAGKRKSICLLRN